MRRKRRGPPGPRPAAAQAKDNVRFPRGATNRDLPRRPDFVAKSWMPAWSAVGLSVGQALQTVAIRRVAPRSQSVAGTVSRRAASHESFLVLLDRLVLQILNVHAEIAHPVEPFGRSIPRFGTVSDPEPR
jgi:hypothetical protein